VGATPSLTHDGGGDTKAVVQMVKYALMKYSGDAARVYAMGGSSGAMLTQALMAVYPDVFRAGSARAGVPAGCWADGYASSNQWSDRCAGGQTTKSAQQWGDQVRAMYPGYTGHRPRLQIMQGENDTTISYKNTAESIKEWTNVLGLSTEPSSTDMGYKAANATYNRQFWKNACGFSVFEAWSSPGGTHSMPYEEDDILKFFGLNVKGGADPETDCNGMTGGAGGAPATGGMGGTSGGGTTAGSPGMAGAGGVGMSTGGMGPSAGGSGGVGMSTGGTGGTSTGTGGSGGSGGAPSGTGGVSMGAGGTGGTGGTAMGTGGTAAGTGGTATGNAGAGAKAGSPATGAGGSSTGPNPGTGGDDDQGGGCSIGATQHGRSTLAAMFGLALLAFRRRQRRARGVPSPATSRARLSFVTSRSRHE
jgi:MYXO-CTERM domain-containing protein